MSRREVAVGYAWNLTFGIISRAVFPILQLIFVRMLGQQQMGIYAILVSIFQIAETFRDSGLALTYIADRDAVKEREGAYASLAIIMATFFGILIYLLRWRIASLYGGMPEVAWGLQMVAIAVFLNGFCTIPINKLQKKARFRDAGLADFGATILSFLVALGLILSGFGFAALVWQFFAKSVIYTAVCWFLEPTKIGKPQGSVIRGIWRHSSANLINNLLFTIYTVADTLMVGRLSVPGSGQVLTGKAMADFKTAAAGSYGVAYTYGSKPLEFFTFPLSRTLLIAYSRKNDDLRSLANSFTRTITVSVIALLPVYVLIGVFAKPLVLILLTSKFQDAIPLLSMLSIYCWARSIGALSGNVLVAMKKQIYNVLGWVGAYLTVGAFLFFNRGHLTTYNIVLALTAGAVAVYIVNAVAAFSILKPSRESLERLERGAGIAALTAGLIVVVSNLPFTSWTNLLIALIALPPLHLAGVGMILAGSPTACFSKSGIKRLWEEV